MGRGKGKGSHKSGVAAADDKENEEAKHYSEEMEIDMGGPSSSRTPPRASKFVEATMNSRSSIHPPPNEQWAALGIDHLIEGFNAGAGFSLGKRKAGNENAEKSAPAPASVDRGDAKERAEAAYAEAKRLGLLPAPKVFVRPVTRKPGVPGTSSSVQLREIRLANLHPVSIPPSPGYAVLAQPRPPTLYKSPSKKDLQKQKKLSKRVSDLEHKLAEARKELALTRDPANMPPVPAIPSAFSSTSSKSSKQVRIMHPSEGSSSSRSLSPNPSSLRQVQNIASPNASPPSTTTTTTSTGKIVKKRKAMDSNDEIAHTTVTTDSDHSHDNEPQAAPSTTPQRTPTRLVKKKPGTAMQEKQVMIVVPDASNGVPPMPRIPKNMEGRSSRVVNPDGYGGFEHEMF
ncbi:hypothetical protein P280DRAFT_330236 [Massarina eburnea CBS 473.64]|uniref:Uncharacterized protein n=1 Tax=Massarina eburnea CBS 473.64 TaxID=1395130 RepID=A0A6A6S1C0_9PLEO|nr:hypothetical protein P280DRAFT_330236 [Massarina eburnea CBS 473.64]